MLIKTLPLRRMFSVTLAIWRRLDSDNLALIAAGVAFYAMFALFPGLAALISLWSLWAAPEAVDQQIEMVGRFVPDQAYMLIDEQVDRLIIANDSTLGWAGIVSLLLALWSSRAGVSALIKGLNAVYRERNRPGLHSVLVALGLTAAMIGVALVAIGTVVLLPVILAIFPVGGFTSFLVQAGSWLAVLLALLFGLGILYRYGPNRRAARTPWITPGAVLFLTFWGVVSMLFSSYLANFGNYNEIYGTLGAVVALLMWFFLTAFLVLLGAALNAEIELRTREDSTVGAPKPPGKRGAYVADTIINEAADEAGAAAEIAARDGASQAR